MNDAYNNMDADTRAAIQDNWIDEQERQYQKRGSELKDIHKDCEWRIADDGPPANPLQALVMSLCSSPRDFAEHKFDAYLYGIIVGWDDEAYETFKGQHGWSDDVITYQKRLHQNFIHAWNLLTAEGIK